MYFFFFFFVLAGACTCQREKRRHSYRNGRNPFSSIFPLCGIVGIHAHAPSVLLGTPGQNSNHAAGLMESSCFNHQVTELALTDAISFLGVGGGSHFTRGLQSGPVNRGAQFLWPLQAEDWGSWGWLGTSGVISAGPWVGCGLAHHTEYLV